jgi:hypothetical protein
MAVDAKSSAYLAATRHPWACLVFLVPLLAAYEVGVIWLGGAQPDTLRNGADAWFRWGLARYGFAQLWAAPVLILTVFITRTIWAWSNRPKEILSTTFGMFVESALFALGLWAVSRNFKPILDEFGVVLNIQFSTPAAGQLVTYVGAGIYEEVLFRLGLFSGLLLLLRLVLFPRVIAVPFAAAAGAVAFAAAHHMGPYGEPVNAVVFAFRILAGLYFTCLYVTRGFGVAVGAHAGYDVLVGVTVTT